MAKDYWSVKLSSNDCRSKIPYSDYISCHHWKRRCDGPPVECNRDNCPIIIKDEEKKDETQGS